VPKLVCVGLNYRKHAEEAGQPIPKEPILFMKATTAINGPNDDVVIPKNSKKTDWEVELGIVIGTKAQYVSEADALKHVAGYCVVNDVSEREFQIERGGQWSKGKSCDTFAPMGPYLVTSDEVPDPQALDLWLEVNGERVQSSNTRDMIFTVKQLVSYASQFMTLLPGDVIPTGTPSGVGLGMKPQRFLKPGDTMRVGITGLGEQRQRAVAWSAEPPRH
jgi:2-keto-4-pentenoate hydratase/2-oxohepta-3-ene-1,7-dioic acid hydratase in catechol pathway